MAAKVHFDRIGIFFFIALAWAVMLVPATIANGANITAFGDSITAGQGSSSGGYPPKLETLLNNNGKPSIVANQGRGGEQTPQGISRFDSVLASFPANIVLIMEGTNDANSGISVETTRFNLEAMINKCKAAGVTPVLATLTPSDRNGSETLIPGSWNPMIKALAASAGVKLADQYAAVLPVWGGVNVDGLHPNDTGYQIIAETWYSAIGSMISSSGAVSSASNDSGGGGGCFIATAAFGSPVAKHVMLLKELRDKFLLTNAPGKWFVAEYYRLSPPVANFITHHEGVKIVVRTALYPLLAFSFILLRLSLPMQLVLAAVILLGVMFGTLILRIRRGEQGMGKECGVRATSTITRR
jgi:lysophospholipase L1-like esterase